MIPVSRLLNGLLKDWYFLEYRHQTNIAWLINEQKRTAQPTQVCNRHGGTDVVIIFESSSESEDGGILEIQPQISKVLYVFIQ